MWKKQCSENIYGAVRNELVRHIFEARKQSEVDALKFTAPSAIAFLFNLSRMEIGFLIEPVRLHLHELKITMLVAGEMCSFTWL